MLLLIGILLFFAINTAGGREGALFGLIPAAVGIANLLYAAIQWKKENPSN
jgi:cadmium resistance protein CadD (predicted permease)